MNKKTASDRLVLRLYVAGKSPHSVRAIANLRELLATHARDTYELEIVDTLAEPSRALDDGVFATPTLIKRSEPEQMIVGDLSETEVVLAAIGLPGVAKA